MRDRTRNRIAAVACCIGIAGLVMTACLTATADQPAAPGGPPNRVLRVATVAVDPLIIWEGDNPSGVMIDMWDLIAGQLGVETQYVRIPSLDDLRESVIDGKADLALGPMQVTSDHEKQLDLSHPILHSGLRIAVRQGQQSGFLSALTSLLSWELLALIGFAVALAVVTGHLLWWFERGNNDHSFPSQYPRGVWEAVWWITSMVVTGGCDDKHVDTLLGRLLAFIWMIGGITLIAALTSVLTATMTADRVSGVIHSPRDLAGHTVGCIDQSVAIRSVKDRGGIPQKYNTTREALEGLQLGMVEAVVADSELLMFLLKESATNDMRLVGPVFDAFDYGIGMPQDSPLREPINAAILAMREDGSFERLRAGWLGQHD